MKNLLILMFLTFAMNANASTCKVKLLGLENESPYFVEYARKLLLEKGYLVSLKAETAARFRYCTSCGYYGDGSVLELNIEDKYFKYEDYSNEGLDEMLRRVISRLDYCS